MINLSTNINLSYIKREDYNYPGINDLEIAILALNKEGKTYGEIQKLTGNPSKKLIRQTLIKYNQLIDKQIVKKVENNILKRIVGLTKDGSKYDLDEFGLSTFEIKGDLLNLIDESGEIYTLNNMDERTSKSILYNIGRIKGLDLKSTEF